jgi:hypothetical protein
MKEVWRCEVECTPALRAELPAWPVFQNRRAIIGSFRDLGYK